MSLWTLVCRPRARLLLILLLPLSPVISPGFAILDEIFAYVAFLFFNPAIEVVKIRLRGWCILGVFLLPAFTRLGHEVSGSFEALCQDLLSP